jgi:hypothetical protein
MLSNTGYLTMLSQTYWLNTAEWKMGRELKECGNQ